MRKLVFMSVIGGVSNAAILTAINAGAAAADTEERGSLWAATLFVISLFLFFKTQVYVSTTITSEIEAIIHKLRVRMMDYVRRSELLAIEDIGRSRIIASISGDAAILTQASNMLSFSIQGPVLIGFVAIYVAYLSIVAFALSVLIVSMAGLIFHFRSRRLTAERSLAAEHERRLFDRITDFLDGFKELRLNRPRSDALFDDAVNVSRTAANIKIRAQSETFKQIAYSQGYMYILLGTVVFVAPQFSESLGGALGRQDHRGAALRHRRVFRSGAVDSDPDECQCRGRPYRASGRPVALDRVLRDRRDRVAEELQDDRDARYRVQLCRPAFGRGVPYRADRFHPARR